MPLPVLTGIGHEIDLSIADLMAHLSLKTPTAVADYIVEQALHFEAKIEEWHQQVRLLAGTHLKQASLLLENHLVQLQSRPREVLKIAELLVNTQFSEISTAIQHTLNMQKHQLLSIETHLSMSDPKNILKRGFALIRQNGKLIGRKSKLEQNTGLEINFYDGSIQIQQTQNDLP